MAWDDTEARQVVGGLANSFYMGYDPRGYERSRIADEEMALRRAADARALAEHNARMREADRTWGMTNEIIDGSKGAGLPIPAGQMGGDGYGPPTPAGLTTAKMDPNWLRTKQLQLAAAKGDLASMTSLRKEGEDSELDSGLAAHMSNWRKLTLQEKVAQPWVQAQFNRNPDVPGELAINDKGKLVLTNFDGRGNTKSIDPDLLDRAAAAYFLEQNGRGAAAVTAMSNVGKDYYDRTRQRTEDNNRTMFGLHTAGVADANLDISRANLGLNQQRLSLDKQRIDRESNQLMGLTNGFVVGEDGRLVPTVQGVKFGKTSGVPEMVNIPMQGGGFIPANAFDMNRLQKTVEGMVGQPTGRVDPRTGKPEMYTPESAMEAVRQQIIRSYAPSSVSASGVSPAAVENARKQLRGGTTESRDAPGKPPELTPGPRRGLQPGQSPARLPWETPTGAF